MKSNNHTGRFAGKGYYIALILCAVAIGISGYLYYHNAGSDLTDDPQLQNPTVNQDPEDPDNIQAVATEPSVTDPTVGDPNVPTPGKKPLQTCAPLTGETIMEFAMDCLSYNPTTRDWRVHNGIDIAAEAGDAVCAAADGTVYTTYQDDTMGYTVVIRHEDGYVTVYSSLADNVCVSAGDPVIMGQTIGYVGNTALLETAVGDHLHFSVTYQDEHIDPADFFALG